jgi:hypothetical protein
MRHSLTYVVADVREHPAPPSQTIIIPHCCNDINAMGAGVARALFEKWPVVKSHYHANAELQRLGQVFMIPVEGGTDNPRVYVANMIGQHGVGVDEYGEAPVRYSALTIAMFRINRWMDSLNIPNPVIHCPKFGSALAGGDWMVIEKLIKEIWLPKCPVTVCVTDESEIPKV